MERSDETRSSMVVVVEDDPLIQSLVRTVLEGEFGARTAVAENGREALRLVRETKPNLVMLDLMLPSVNGLEVIAELQADPTTRSIPVIAVSGAPNALRGALKAGAVDGLDKPFELTALAATVSRYLAR